MKDVDLAMQAITVRDGKGGNDRFTVLPKTVVSPPEAQMDKVLIIHDQDLAKGLGQVYPPFALARRHPGAATEWGWQFVFPAAGYAQDPVRIAPTHRR